MSRLRLVTLGLGVLLVVGALGCGGDDGDADADGEPTTTTAPTTTEVEASTTTAVEEVVIDAYLAARQAQVDALVSGQVVTEPLRNGWTPAALVDLSSQINQSVNDDLSFRGTTEFHPTVVAVDGTSAELTDCFSDGLEVVANATGAVVTPAGAVYNQRIQMVLDGELWKIQSIDTLGEPCTPDG